MAELSQYLNQGSIKYRTVSADTIQVTSTGSQQITPPSGGRVVIHSLSGDANLRITLDGRTLWEGATQFFDDDKTYNSTADSITASQDTFGVSANQKALRSLIGGQDEVFQIEVTSGSPSYWLAYSLEEQDVSATVGTGFENLPDTIPTVSLNAGSWSFASDGGPISSSNESANAYWQVDLSQSGKSAGIKAQIDYPTAIYDDDFTDTSFEIWLVEVDSGDSPVFTTQNWKYGRPAGTGVPSSQRATEVLFSSQQAWKTRQYVSDSGASNICDASDITNGVRGNTLATWFKSVNDKLWLQGISHTGDTFALDLNWTVGNTKDYYIVLHFHNYGQSESSNAAKLFLTDPQPIGSTVADLLTLNGK